jgi:hypothetical protein
MKPKHLALLLLASLLSAVAWAEPVDWPMVESIAPGTLIAVATSTTEEKTVCYFESATDAELLCRVRKSSMLHSTQTETRSFSRDVIKEVCASRSCMPPDPSAGFLSMILGAEGGGGWDTNNQPNSFFGMKIGGAAAVDLQYDRINGQNGFSVEGSGVLPLLRVPAFHVESDNLLFKLYAEPGVGYRAGGGPFGGYSSAKILVLLGDKWINGDAPTPYIEFQRRFPFNAPLDGDNRIAVGISLTFCGPCDVDVGSN